MSLSIPDWIYIDAVRYAIGRRSYQVGVTCQWLVDNWWSLPTEVANQIQKDIDSAWMIGQLGSHIDATEWERVRALWS